MGKVYMYIHYMMTTPTDIHQLGLFVQLYVYYVPPGEGMGRLYVYNDRFLLFREFVVRSRGVKNDFRKVAI